MTLKGKTLFITGGSRGIGLAIALRAAGDGANVVIAAKTAQPHATLPGTIYTAAAALEQAGARALPVPCDIRDEGQVQAAVDAAIATFGAVDICINNCERDRADRNIEDRNEALRSECIRSTSAAPFCAPN